jgi:hypothetical protein
MFAKALSKYKANKQNGFPQINYMATAALRGAFGNRVLHN